MEEKISKEIKVEQTVKMNFPKTAPDTFIQEVCDFVAEAIENAIEDEIRRIKQTIDIIGALARNDIQEGIEPRDWLISVLFGIARGYSFEEVQEKINSQWKK